MPTTRCHSYDAIIIGAGPAGAMTALLLARRGWRVALVERQPRHRRKACGHWLHPRAVDVLRRAGVLDRVRAEATGAAPAVVVHQPGQTPVETLRAEAMVVARHRFDQLLIDAAAGAGVAVMQPAPARVNGAVHVGGPAPSVLTAPLIVGADGVRSAVARSLGLRRDSAAGRKYGFSLDAAGAWDDDRLHMFIVDHGYLGLFGRDGVVHLGGLVSPRAPARDPLEFVRDVARRFAPLRAAGLHELDRGDVVASGPMPCVARDVACARGALVGDAAGYVEPFTGEGMRWALQSAALLDQTVAGRSPGTWSEDRGRAYARAWRRRIGAGHRRCRMLAWVLERPAWRRGLLSAASRRPALTRIVANRVMMRG